MDYRVACPHCQQQVGIMAVQIGQTLRCPHCSNVFTVSLPSGGAPAGRAFSFACTQCRSRLEATTGQIGQRGLCPTCGVEFVIPSPASAAARTGGTEPETEYAQPVHAYAAAGERAPKIRRRPDGTQVIQCTRCQRENPVTANNCLNCAMPFTLEGSEVGPSEGSGGLQTASLVLGIIGVVASCTFVPSLLAVIFGVLSMRGAETEGQASWRSQAAWGIGLGCVGLLLGAVIVLTTF